MKNSKKNAEDVITELILDRLKQGEIPWKMPWKTLGIRASNFVSKTPYQGINAMLLNTLWADPYFLTFKQAKSLGGQVRKGSKASPVTYWNFTYRDQNGRKIQPTSIGNYAPGELKKSGFLKYYSVFNQSQIDGIDWPKIEAELIDENQRIEKCETLVNQMPLKPEIFHKENAAYYSPSEDFVNMPPFGNFVDPQSYYQTLFHELSHSTKHPSRLNRKKLSEGGFGSRGYAFEELVAEMSASFLSNSMRIDTEPLVENTVAYIQNWIKVLSSDTSFIIKAASQAKKASDWILGTEKTIAAKIAIHEGTKEILEDLKEKQ
jgi:antirestriction protein ArdC